MTVGERLSAFGHFSTRFTKQNSFTHYTNIFITNSLFLTLFTYVFVFFSSVTIKVLHSGSNNTFGGLRPVNI